MNQHCFPHDQGVRGCIDLCFRACSVIEPHFVKNLHEVIMPRVHESLNPKPYEGSCGSFMDAEEELLRCEELRGAAREEAEDPSRRARRKTGLRDLGRGFRV